MIQYALLNWHLFRNTRGLEFRLWTFWCLKQTILSRRTKEAAREGRQMWHSKDVCWPFRCRRFSQNYMIWWSEYDEDQRVKPIIWPTLTVAYGNKTNFVFWKQIHTTDGLKSTEPGWELWLLLFMASRLSHNHQTLTCQFHSTLGHHGLSVASTLCSGFDAQWTAGSTVDCSI